MVLRYPGRCSRGDTDTSGIDSSALTYDAVGNLTNDGQTYKFEYDAFGRLRKIKDQSNNPVEEFRTTA